MLIGFLETTRLSRRNSNQKRFPTNQRSGKKIKEALSLEKMKAQAKLHHAVAERNKAKFEEKDREMLNEIEKISSAHVRQQLQELWRNDCKKQEEKSQNLWELKKSWFKKFECNGENIANSEDAAPTPPTNQAQKRGKRRNARQLSNRRRNNSRPRKNNQYNNTNDRNRNTANSRNNGNRVSQQRRKKGQQRNSTQNSRQQRSRPQERNSNRNTGNNRRVRNNNRASKDNDRSTGRSTYNRRPFLGQGRYSNPNQT